MRNLGIAGSIALVITLTTSPALATNGYFSHGYGTISKGMAGAGAALAVDFMAAATNPAATVVVGPGVDFGVAIFTPDREYGVTGQPSGFPGTFGLAPGTVRSGSRLFAIPHVAIAWKAGARGVFSLAMYGSGMNTAYAAPTFGVSPTGVDLSQMFVAPTYSVRLDDRHAVGVSAILGYQRFEANGLAAFSAFSGNPAALTNLDHSHSLGAGMRVGYLGDLSPHFSVGASYQTKVWMNPFDEYQGLFAGNGDFDVPSNVVVGIAIKPTPALDLAFDVQRVNYSEVEAVGNHLMPNMMQSPLGSATGAGFGWDDVTVGKFGVQIRAGRGFTWRGGYSYGNQPVPSSEVLFNILAPGVVAQHATFGVSKDLSGGRAINLAVMHAFNRSVSGPNPLEVPGLQHIELSMKEWEIELGYTIRFR